MRVVCRLRPPLSKAPAAGEADKTLRPRGNDIVVVEASGTTEFTFDQVLDHSIKGEEVYSLSCKGSVEAFLDGSDACILTYGQTSSGKTYTIKELIPLIADSLFAHERSESGERSLECTATLQAIEIYNEKIIDLIGPMGNGAQSPPEISIFETVTGKVELQGILQEVLTSTEEFVQAASQVLNRRAVTATTANSASSRSHCILRVSMASYDLFLVDLAGSEKMKRTEAQGRAAIEAGYINKSLSTLSNVMRTLSYGAKYVPFRDSKLTRILQHALRENSATTLILCCSPDQRDISETVSTMKFGFNVAMAMPVFKPKSSNERPSNPFSGDSQVVAQLELENKDLKIKVASLEHTQEFLERSLVGLRKQVSEKKNLAPALSEPENATSHGGRLRKARNTSIPAQFSVLVSLLFKAALALQIIARISLVVERIVVY